MRNPVDRQMSWKNEAAARHWDRAVRHKSRNWWDSTILNGYMNRQICGAQVEAGAAIATALRNAFPDTAFARAASVGCGTAAKELALIRNQIRFEVAVREGFLNNLKDLRSVRYRRRF